MTPPVALTIAGSDSGGGAGAQADLKMFAALGVFGTTAITAITAQNTVGVHHVEVLPAEVVGSQIDAVVEDLTPRAAKTGMLATTGIIEIVAERAAAGMLPPLVVDPVMVASSGDRLLDPSAEAAYLECLLPTAAVVTPNLREATVLLGDDVRSLDEMRDAARLLAAFGSDWVLIKGGHLDGDAVDVLFDATTGAVDELHAPRIATGNVHGTGCSLAAAIAARLAHGDGVADAVSHAKSTVHRAIAGGAPWHLGAGHGPIDHFGWTRTVPGGAATTEQPKEHR